MKFNSIRPAARSPAAPPAPARAFHLPSPPLPFAPANALPPCHRARAILLVDAGISTNHPRLRARAAPSSPSNVMRHGQNDSFHPITILAPCPDPPPAFGCTAIFLLSTPRSAARSFTNILKPPQRQVQPVLSCVHVHGGSYQRRRRFQPLPAPARPTRRPRSIKVLGAVGVNVDAIRPRHARNQRLHGPHLCLLLSRPDAVTSPPSHDAGAGETSNEN
ncbi:hypothetical protein B0H14DRAFT_3694122 [Mycena olivaceomarginata]|nr:hypothetical protein B0H14DRAFT_3694122 [Mycena olivaceomarginata]